MESESTVEKLKGDSKGSNKSNFKDLRGKVTGCRLVPPLNTTRFRLSQSLVPAEPRGRKHLAYIINVAWTHAEVVQKGRNNRDRRCTIWSHLQGLEEHNHAILAPSCQRCSVPE